MNEKQIQKLVAEELSVKGENNFVREVYKHNMKSLDILNWYRNLHYKEGNDTERGVMAMAINELFIKMSKGL